MPFASTCIAQLNQSISTRLSSTGAQLFGLCQLMQREGETIPAYVDNNGLGEYTGPDDSFRYILYHRATTLGVVESIANNQFGDGDTSISESIRMRCVVYGTRYRLKMNNTDLASIICSSLKSRIDASAIDGLRAARVENIQAELDPVSVFLTEYQLPATSYNVPSDSIYLAVNYSLIIDYDTSCITDCATC